MQKVVMALALVAALSSCASKKKLAEIKSLKEANEKVLVELRDCNTKTAELQALLRNKDTDIQSRVARLAELEQQLEFLKKTNTNLLDRLSDLSVVSKAGAESIRKSLETLNDQSKYITNLNQSIQKKDSLNLALVMNLKRSLADVNDQDVQVEVKKGVVYVSISDKLLFESASYEVTKPAETVLGKVARVVNDHKELDILVEGHTDVWPIQTQYMKDNWDLSVMRATSVVRTLQTKFGVRPDRMTAGGRSEFVPKTDNTTEEGRRVNRRTEIILTPKLDQFFNLMTTKG